MGGEQAATVLATIAKDQKAREGKQVCLSAFICSNVIIICSFTGVAHLWARVGSCRVRYQWTIVLPMAPSTLTNIKYLWNVIVYIF